RLSRSPRSGSRAARTSAVLQHRRAPVVQSLDVGPIHFAGRDELLRRRELRAECADRLTHSHDALSINARLARRGRTMRLAHFPRDTPLLVRQLALLRNIDASRLRIFLSLFSILEPAIWQVRFR